MTDPSVPRLPVLPPTGPITIARAVRGRHWRQVAALQNYLLGRGPQLIPAYAPAENISPGSSLDYRWKIWLPQSLNLECWMFQLAATAEPGPQATIEIDIGSGQTVTRVAPWASSNVAPFFFFINRTGGSAGETERTVRISNSASSANSLKVLSIGCTMVPRAFLAADATEDGVLADSCTPGEPIYSITGHSYGGIAIANEELADKCTRAGMLQWAVGLDASAVQATASPVTIGRVIPIALGRLYRASDTLRNIQVRYYVKCSDGTTAGTISLAATNGATGDSSPVAIPAGTTALTWFSDSIDVDAEDLSAADGLRGATWDEVTATVTRTAGAGTIYVRSYCWGEP